MSVSLGGALLLWSCSHRYPSPGTVQRYLPSWAVGTVPPPSTPQLCRAGRHSGGESDPGPWLPPLSGTPARLLAWVQHCVRLAATITPLCWVLAARKMLMGTSCPIPLLVDVPPPTPTPCSLLACKYLPLSPPLLLSLHSPSAIHSSFLSPEPVLPNRHLPFLTAFRNGGKENTTHWAASTSAPSCRSSSQPRVPPEDRTGQDKLNPPERVREPCRTSPDIYLGFQEHKRGINIPPLVIPSPPSAI